MTTIHAFDPGETTGYAILEAVQDALHVTELRELRIERLDSFYEIQKSLGPSDIFVIEDFRLYPGKAASLSWNSMPAVKVIGMLEYIAYLRSILVIKQMASMIATLKDADVLKRVNLNEEVQWPKSPHMKDALKHGVCYWLRFIRSSKVASSS